jgi:energy-converting hydrogenase Eha subunit E
LITAFGVTTAPLVLFIAADAAVTVLLVRSCLALRRYGEGVR